MANEDKCLVKKNVAMERRRLLIVGGNEVVRGEVERTFLAFKTFFRMADFWDGIFRRARPTRLES